MQRFKTTSIILKFLFINILITLSIPFNGISNCFAKENIALIADQDEKDLINFLQKISPFFYYIDKKEINKRNICLYKKVLIIGPETYLKIKKNECPQQITFLAGILYPSLLRVKKEVIIISPLPHYKILKPLSKKWITIYSEYMKYYVKYLKDFLEIETINVQDPYELPDAFQRIQKEKNTETAFLILPDPIFVDPKGQTYLIAFLKRYPLNAVDLLGIPEIKGKKISFSEKDFAKTIIKAIKTYSPSQRNRIIYNKDINL